MFNAIQANSYPWSKTRFCVFALLVNGFGDVSFFIDIRQATSHTLTYTTAVQTLHFPDRTTAVKVVMNIIGCEFPQPDLYTVELFCDNTWVADTTVLLH